MKKKIWALDSKTWSNLFIVLVGILFYVALTHFHVIRARIGSVLNVLAPFIAGFAIAYLLNTPASFFERKVFRKLKWKRTLSILSVYLLALLVVVVLLNMILPQVVESVVALIGNLESYFNNLNGWVDSLTARFDLDWDGVDDLLGSYHDLLSGLASIVQKALPKLLNYGIALGSGIVAGVTALISSIYMLSGKHTLIKQIKSLLFALFPAKKVEHFLHTCGRANEIFAGFINGKIIDSAIIGVLCVILCMILRIPFAPLISTFIGVTNLIPFFGPLIGAIPSVMILIIVDPWAALRFGVMIIVLQQFDGNFLGPKILGNSTGLSPIWVLVAIVVGGGLFGFVGMLLGVPAFAVIYMLTRDFVASRLAAKRIDREGNPLPAPEEDREREQTDPEEVK